MAPVIMPLTAIKHLLAIPEPVHENIVRYVGGTGEDPENYGSSLVNLAEAFPYFEELVIQWFEANVVTIKTIGKL